MGDGRCARNSRSFLPDPSRIIAIRVLLPVDDLAAAFLTAALFIAIGLALGSEDRRIPVLVRTVERQIPAIVGDGAPIPA